MKNAKFLLIKYSPLILTSLGSVGVVVTSVLTAKGTIQAKKLVEKVEESENCKLTLKDDWQDIVKIAWKPYIPAVISGVSTISCIFGAHFLNRRAQASIASAYALLSNTYKEYVEKSKELYGEDAEQKIQEQVAKSKFDTTFITVDTDNHLFFDYQSMRYFETTFDDLKRAEDFVNQELAASGYVHLNTFYEALGIDKLENFGNSMGWCDEGDYKEIVFEHERILMDDCDENGNQLECFIVTMTAPTELYFL